MARNIEIKARVSNLAAIRAKASALASSPVEILNQTDTFFVVPHGRLKAREFSDGSGDLISYERSNQPGPKESAYQRYTCPNVRLLLKTLSAVLPVRGTVVKRREVFMVGRSRVHLDEVTDLGSFIELEVVLEDGESAENGEREAQSLMDALEIPHTALIAEAYIDLLERLPSN